MAMVARALVAADGIDHSLCVTAQHREMMDPVLRLFGLEPDYDLDVMSPGQQLADVTSGVLQGMRGVLEETGPDRVLVQGDTTTVLATAMAAFYARIPVGHVEAGLRTRRHVRAVARGDEQEGGRRPQRPALRSHRDGEAEPAGRGCSRFGDRGDGEHGDRRAASRGWAPANRARSRRSRESGASRRRPRAPASCWSPATGGRTSGPGSSRYAARSPGSGPGDDVEVVYPVHLNPNVREPVFRLLGGHPNIKLIEPLDYLAFVYLMTQAHIILTDSGGIQEEAPSLGKPVLVMRGTTERPEAVASGNIRLVRHGYRSHSGRDRPPARRRRGPFGKWHASAIPFGDGHASRRILEDLARG